MLRLKHTKNNFNDLYLLKKIISFPAFFFGDWDYGVRAGHKPFNLWRLAAPFGRASLVSFTVHCDNLLKMSLFRFSDYNLIFPVKFTSIKVSSGNSGAISAIVPSISGDKGCTSWLIDPEELSENPRVTFVPKARSIRFVKILCIEVKK